MEGHAVGAVATPDEVGGDGALVTEAEVEVAGGVVALHGDVLVVGSTVPLTRPTTTMLPSGWRARSLAVAGEAAVGVDGRRHDAADAERVVEGAVGVVAGQRVVAGRHDLAVGLHGDTEGGFQVGRGDLAAVAEARVEVGVGRRGDAVDGDVGDVGLGDGAGTVRDRADLDGVRRLGVDGDVVGLAFERGVGELERPVAGCDLLEDLFFSTSPVPSRPVTVPPIVNSGSGSSSTIVSTVLDGAPKVVQLGSDRARLTVLSSSAIASFTISTGTARRVVSPSPNLMVRAQRAVVGAGDRGAVAGGHRGAHLAGAAARAGDEHLRRGALPFADRPRRWC